MQVGVGDLRASVAALSDVFAEKAGSWDEQQRQAKDAVSAVTTHFEQHVERWKVDHGSLSHRLAMVEGRLDHMRKWMRS